MRFSLHLLKISALNVGCMLLAVVLAPVVIPLACLCEWVIKQHDKWTRERA
jgi:hypothetical protein